MICYIGLLTVMADWVRRKKAKLYTLKSVHHGSGSELHVYLVLTYCRLEYEDSFTLRPDTVTHTELLSLIGCYPRSR
jgi:hypothetical protein